MIGFGFRIYSQHEDIIKEPKEWSKIHQEVISLIMNWPNENINFDNKGRLIVFEDIETSRYEDNDNDGNPHYPSGYDLECIISVAASDNRDRLAGFSNYGIASVDLAAPGVDIYSCGSQNDQSYETRYHW